MDIKTHEPTDLHTPFRETLTKAHRRLKSETLAAGAVVEKDRYLHQDEISGGGNARELSLNAVKRGKHPRNVERETILRINTVKFGALCSFVRASL